MLSLQRNCYESSAEIFELESIGIKNIINLNFIEIHHIGSTSIKNIVTKPQIDIALEVVDLQNSLLLEKIGYIYKGELNIPLRYFFSKNDENLRLNLHVCKTGNPEIQGFIMFRDYLRNHQDAAIEYSLLKEKILNSKTPERKNKYGLPDYNLMKNDFIISILKKAGFEGLCIRHPIHYREIEYIGKMSFDITYFVFYKGPYIIGSAGIKNHKTIFFKIEDDKYKDYFEEQMNYYLL